MSSSLQEIRVKQSATVLANAAELTVNVIRAVVGNDISDSLNGNRLTANTIRTLAHSRFRRQLDAIPAA